MYAASGASPIPAPSPKTWHGASAWVPQCALIVKHVDPHGAPVWAPAVSRHVNGTSPGHTGVVSEIGREMS
jgi:hypothetical protein